MSKKISTIFLSLFLVGILSVSCSNSDKTGAGETTKGIEQYNNNFYVSTSAVLGSAYLWVSIKDGKVGMLPNNNTTPPDFTGKYMTGPITGSGTDYTFDSGDGTTKGTLKFSDTSVTVTFTKNEDMPSIVDQDIVCNKK
ncbi:hypothetical protein [Brachyspira pulli]|uniref:hypothetical protein n=1 Tax=Brachyspira pulli TaxID=310721 RepID=UPI0030066150